MKNLKKLTGLLLAVVMVIALAAPAMATTITIKPNDTLGEGTDTGESYSAYKILDAEVTGTETPGTDGDVTFGNVRYTAASDNVFVDVFNEYASIFEVQENGDGYLVSLKAGVDSAAANAIAVELATKLKAVIDANNIPATATSNTSAQLEVGAGYYLIVSTLGSKMIVDTVGEENIEITTKNDFPSVVLHVNDASGWASATTASYGEDIEFKATVTVPETADKAITVTVTLDPAFEGITSTDPRAVVDEVAKTVTFTIPSETVAATNGDIELNYTAKLVPGAATETDHANTAVLTYETFTSAESVATVQTYEFDLVKTNSAGAKIDGATFTLAEGETAISFTLEGDVYSVAPNGTVTEISVGKVTIKGLGNGNYTLTETAAPDGYNKLDAPETVAITGANNSAVLAGEDTYTGGVQVKNYTGTELPETGGIGTTIFYIVGGLLVVGAAILLITKKRMNGQER